MSENGAEKRGSIFREVTEQLSEHADLAALELRYETHQAGKRLMAAAIIFVLVLTGFIVLQISLVDGLRRAGLSLGLASLLLSFVYGMLAFAVFWTLGRRDKRAGPAFIGTQREIHETLRWIQKVFS